MAAFTRQLFGFPVFGLSGPALTILAAWAALGLGGPAHAQTTITDTTPGTMPFVVPSGVTSLLVTLEGAGGARSVGSGGSGALVSGTLSVTPDEMLQILVGGGGSNNGSGGFGGGGDSSDSGGGGRSAIIMSGTDLVDAGGGGGSGFGGNGGNGGQNGGDGSGAITYGGGSNATGGTQTAGGSGGGDGSGFNDGGDGSQYQGGGGSGTGGGGGGGYFGGGGGIDDAGGGGGSSLTNGPGFTLASETDGGALNGGDLNGDGGDGSVTITYGASPAPEPSGWAALAFTGLGLAGLRLRAHRRLKQ